MIEETAENKTTSKITGPKITGSKKIPRINWAAGLLGIVVIFMLGSGTAVYFLPVLMERVPLLARWLGQEDTLKSSISALASRLDQQGSAIQTLKEENNQLIQGLDGLKSRAKATDPAVLVRLDKLEKATRRSGKPPENLSQAARIDMLLGRMSQLEASFIPLSKGLAEAQEARRERSQLVEVTASQSALLKRMKSRLEAVEAYAARDNNGAMLAFTISNLRRGIISGATFTPELVALENMLSRGSLAQNDNFRQSINWLYQHKSGIVPFGRLRAQFDRLVPKMIRAKFTNRDDPWWKKAYNRIKNLIIIRKTEPSETMDSDNIIADVERMLARGDLKNAVGQLKLLPDNMRNVAGAWIKQATIYLQAGIEINRIKNLAAAYYLAPPDKKIPDKKIPDEKIPDEKNLLSVPSKKEPSS